jgi:hypothetical protein
MSWTTQRADEAHTRRETMEEAEFELHRRLAASMTNVEELERAERELGDALMASLGGVRDHVRDDAIWQKIHDNPYFARRRAIESAQEAVERAARREADAQAKREADEAFRAECHARIKAAHEAVNTTAKRAARKRIQDGLKAGQTWGQLWEEVQNDWNRSGHHYLYEKWRKLADDDELGHLAREADYAEHEAGTAEISWADHLLVEMSKRHFSAMRSQSSVERFRALGYRVQVTGHTLHLRHKALGYRMAAKLADDGSTLALALGDVLPTSNDDPRWMISEEDRKRYIFEERCRAAGVRVETWSDEELVRRLDAGGLDEATLCMAQAEARTRSLRQVLK